MPLALLGCAYMHVPAPFSVRATAFGAAALSAPSFRAALVTSSKLRFAYLCAVSCSATHMVSSRM